MNNTLKYSAADQCIFKSEIKNGRVFFIFKDDGNGFDSMTTDYGNGLKNMKERAEKIGGEFQVETSRNNGTNITISIPVAADVFLMEKN